LAVINDVANLFKSMRIAYGAQWKHGSDAIGVWLGALQKFSADEILNGANECMALFIDYPPTLPQFLKIMEPLTRPNTYLPPRKTTQRERQVNLAFNQAMNTFGGVDSLTLKKMLEKKAEMLDAKNDEFNKLPVEKFATEATAQMRVIASKYDKQKCSREAAIAREKFIVRQGMQRR